MVVQHMARFSVLEAQKIRIEPVPIKDTSCKRILIDSCVIIEMLQDPEFQNNLFKLFDGTTKPVVVDKCLYEVQKVTGWKTSVVKDDPTIPEPIITKSNSLMKLILFV